MIVSPARSTAPAVALGVKVVVQVEFALAPVGERVLLTLVGVVAAVIEKVELVNAAVSTLVATAVSVATPVVPVGFVIPATATETAAPDVIEQVPPLSISVIVATLAAITPVALQLLTLAPPSVTFGEAG